MNNIQDVLFARSLVKSDLHRPGNLLLVWHSSALGEQREERGCATVLSAVCELEAKCEETFCKN